VATGSSQVGCTFATLPLGCRRTTIALSELNYAEWGPSVTDPSGPGNLCGGSRPFFRSDSHTSADRCHKTTSKNVMSPRAPSFGSTKPARLQKALSVPFEAVSCGRSSGCSGAQYQAVGNTSVFVRAFPSVGKGWSLWLGCARSPKPSTERQALKREHRRRGRRQCEMLFFATSR
jgi:hypothetical protein